MGKLLKKLAVGVGLAAVAGYLAGILTAPKSGKETREDIKNAAVSGKAEAEKQLKKLVSELGDMVEETKKRGLDLGDKANKELADLVDKAKAAREKAREVVTAIHDGDAEDEDLKLAVSQANTALRHLRDYLKK